MRRHLQEEETLRKQMQNLDAEADDLEKELVHLARRAADVAPMEYEIGRYERLVYEMSEMLLRWEVEMAAGSRVKLIQSDKIKECNGEEL